MGKVFTRAYAPSTLGSFLRAFTFGHVRQLDAILCDLGMILDDAFGGEAFRTSCGQRPERTVAYGAPHGWRTPAASVSRTCSASSSGRRVSASISTSAQSAN